MEDCGIDRREFVRFVSLGSAASAGRFPQPADAAPIPPSPQRPASEQEKLILGDQDWPSLRLYDQEHLARIALPLGGIGTGTVSLGGRGDLRDWEIMNRPAKGFVPSSGDIYPFFAIFTQSGEEKSRCRILEGPLEFSEYEGSHGSTVPNDNLPRFARCYFAAAYPFGRVVLSDPEMPVEVHLKTFNPLVPADPEASGIPIAILTYVIHNRIASPLSVALCGSAPNFIGIDGWETRRDWKGDAICIGAAGNHNEFRDGTVARGIFMSSDGVAKESARWGTIALATTAAQGVTHRTIWARDEWGNTLLDFWDDFAADGKLDPREAWKTETPVASLAVKLNLAAGATAEVTYLLAWHFPNRETWTPKKDAGQENIIGNFYTTQYLDAWDVIEKTVPRIPELREKSALFVRSFCSASLPEEVREAALFNLSTLRTQTCFRTPDGRFFGWEGSSNHLGCCHGSCTHVWNYEQATPFLFGSLAMSMREVEYAHATGEDGLMSFRVHLPLSRGREFAKAAADGQMGCIMKMYRDWQLSGDDATLRQLWPKVKKALEFCWIPGGWDGDRDGVMEGCQHNTMDVEYYGPNPQMGVWYLGALRAAEEMARHLGESAFAGECRSLFEKGRQWIDANLFNGEYYQQIIRPPRDKSDVAPSLLVGMGAKDMANPDYQLGAGCLVDQLVGQYMAHVCGLGYLLNPEHVRKTLKSILKYNTRPDLHSHFNCLRSFALGSEAALLMASYPKDRPRHPFPYFTEVMTGFEYTAAVGLLYEEMTQEGVLCIRNIRQRYDGRKRSPFDEAECGHHYARAMASWAAVLALTGFHYSAVTGTMEFADVAGRHFWSNGYAWGTCTIQTAREKAVVQLAVLHGDLKLERFELRGYSQARVSGGRISSGKEISLTLVRL